MREDSEKLFGWQWSGKKVALTESAIEPLEVIDLCRCLGPFCDDIESQGPGEVQNRPDDLAAPIIPVHACDEGSIDLQRVHGEALQIAQRRIPCSEIIEAEPYAERLELDQNGTGTLGIRHRGALRDFQPQAASVEPGFLQRVRHLLHNVGLAEASGGDVHADGGRRIAGVTSLPLARL